MEENCFLVIVTNLHTRELRRMTRKDENYRRRDRKLNGSPLNVYTGDYLDNLLVLPIAFFFSQFSQFICVVYINKQ